MKKKITYLIDVLGDKYIGLKFDQYEIENYITKFENYCDDNDIDYPTLKDNREKRDGSFFHTTFLSVSEYHKVIESGDMLIDKEIKIKILGIGCATKNNSVTYFLILKSDSLQTYRNKLGFKNKDLHITLGFDTDDIFGVDKGINSLI